MYHTTCSIPWLMSSNLQQTRLPIYLSPYGDIPFFGPDQMTTLACYGHLPSNLFPMEMTTIRRLPVGRLMQNITPNNYQRPWWRRNSYQSQSTCQSSKESIPDSSSSGSENGATESRPSTPSSGCTSLDDSQDQTSKNSANSSVKREKRQLNVGSLLSSRPFPHYKLYTIKKNRYYFANEHIRRFNDDYPISDPPFPPHLMSGDSMLKVSQAIWKHFSENKQTEETYVSKLELGDALYRRLCTFYPFCQLHIVGSSVNGLGTNTSDVDICLMVSLGEIDQQTEATRILKNILRALTWCNFIRCANLIRAKVPILKFTDAYSGIQVDLNVNNQVGIWNTYLIKNYCRLDWRVQPLILVIKHWAQECDINNAKDMTLSSYSLVLMVIHYLQYGCSPPVLPCLQRMRQRRFPPSYFTRWQDHHGFPYFKSKNTQSLGELLMGFLEYYSSKFNFEKDAMSVRLGCSVSKQTTMNYYSAKNKRGHWKYISIEEPFDRTNTACAVYDEASFNRILQAFRSSWNALKETKELDSIFRIWL